MNKKQISIPIQLTKSKTIYFKPLEAVPVIFISVGWLVMCYVAILSGFYNDVLDNIYPDYSSERTMTIIKFLLAPGAIGLSYGNALLAKGGRSLFWLRFIVGSIVILAISVWLVFPLSFLIKL